MKCFNHRDRDAIGICKVCGKGLCQECLVEIPKGIACKDTCMEYAIDVTEVVNRNIETAPVSYAIMSKLRARCLKQSFIELLVGLFALVIFFWSGEKDELFLPVFGAIFIVLSAVTFVRALTIPKTNHKK